MSHTRDIAMISRKPKSIGELEISQLAKMLSSEGSELVFDVWSAWRTPMIFDGVSDEFWCL